MPVLLGVRRDAAREPAMMALERELRSMLADEAVPLRRGRLEAGGMVDVPFDRLAVED